MRARVGITESSCLIRSVSSPDSHVEIAGEELAKKGRDDQKKGLSPQSSNVTLEQSRNVPLTTRRWRDAGRATTDDPSRTGSAGDVEESAEKIDHEGASSRRVGTECAASEALGEGAAKARRQGSDPWVAGTAVEPPDRGEHSGEGHRDCGAGRISRIRAHASVRVPGEEIQDRGEPGDAAPVDEASGIMERQAARSGAGAPVPAAAEPVRGTGAVGHQQSRLAGGAGRTAVLDR